MDWSRKIATAMLSQTADLYLIGDRYCDGLLAT